MQELKQGTPLQGGKYIIKRVLGQGGFGITYLAEQVSLGRKVAIKEFFMKDGCLRDQATGFVTVPTTGAAVRVEQFREKFLKEARTLASLDHPHIVGVIDVFKENGTAYYSMTYMTNGSLKSFVKSHGPLPEAEALRYVGQVASALKYMHAKHLCHYDVKPDNILIDNYSNAVLIDFGISKNYDDQGRETSGTPIGISDGYAPIEQYQGISEFSPASDVYALGATLYFLLMGKTPPSAPEITQGEELMTSSSVSDKTTALITSAMQIMAKKRPQDVSAFIIDNDAAPLLQSNYNQHRDSGSVENARPLRRNTPLINDDYYDDDEFPELIKDESLLVPDRIVIELSNPDLNELSYKFYLNTDICNTVFVYRNGKNILDEDWAGGINQEIIDSLRRNGFFSKYHWENEQSTTPPTGIHVLCEFQFNDGTKFSRSHPCANYAFHARLLNAVEHVVKETYLSDFLRRAEGNVPSVNDDRPTVPLDENKGAETQTKRIKCPHCNSVLEIHVPDEEKEKHVITCPVCKTKLWIRIPKKDDIYPQLRKVSPSPNLSSPLSPGFLLKSPNQRYVIVSTVSKTSYWITYRAKNLTTDTSLPRYYLITELFHEGFDKRYADGQVKSDPSPHALDSFHQEALKQTGLSPADGDNFWFSGAVRRTKSGVIEAACFSANGTEYFAVIEPWKDGDDIITGPESWKDDGDNITDPKPKASFFRSLFKKKNPQSEIKNGTDSKFESESAHGNFILQERVVEENRQEDSKYIYVNGVKITMRFIKGGKFMMGSTERTLDARTNEMPAHMVTLSDFYLSAFEVTQELWMAVMDHNPSYFSGDMQAPVECVSWDDCQEFIYRLNRLTGKNFRLPYEAEWEYAADYISGPIGESAWYHKNCSKKKSYFRTHAVGQKKPNKYGLYDMFGNVWEWCHDIYGEYTSEHQTNPKGPLNSSQSKVYRVCRGSHFNSDASECNKKRRHAREQTLPNQYHGFRLAASSL